MTQPLRIQSANVLFHIINRGNHRKEVFRDDSDREQYLVNVKKYKRKFAVRVFHYVLMPNHVHLLVEPTKANTLSRFMQGITISHTKRFNSKYGLVGHAWQGRFRAIPIEADSYYLSCARYIELNPVKAGLAAAPDAYPWSSYVNSIDVKTESWLDVHPLLEQYRQKTAKGTFYERFVADGMDAMRTGLFERFSEASIYGSESFIQQFHDLQI